MAEVADVEEPVVCWAVIAAQAGAVHGQADGQVLQGDVMDEHVISPLHERAVNGQKRTQSLDGLTAGK